ncbi:hypothetical protein HDU99_000299 [Rhizoclosmatium hyalinum]|nr:hypothetical protein HDU99_000299 [Rhizoclosmatium hyalinum]
MARSRLKILFAVVIVALLLGLSSVFSGGNSQGDLNESSPVSPNAPAVPAKQDTAEKIKENDAAKVIEVDRDVPAVAKGQKPLKGGKTEDGLSTTPPRVLYYNRHSACHANMVQVTSKLGLTFKTLNPGFLGGLGMKGDRADSIINDGFVRTVCETADVIIVADTMPDARPLFQSLARESLNERCKTNIVLELTTRFDWGVPDQEEYYKLIWKLSHMKPKNLYWVTNNAFEPLDIMYETLGAPLFRMLRPTGHTQLDAKEIPESDAKLALCREEEDSAVFQIMKQLSIPFKHMKGGYGGPKTLAKYKAFIEVPYQVSTMKLYENLAAGVVMLFPSKDFFQELIEKELHSFGPWDKIARAGKDWYLYMDYYHPDISPYVYYFDSFEHLKELLTADVLDTKNVRVEAPKVYKKLVDNIYHGWADLFNDMGYSVDVHGAPHVRGSGPKPFRVPVYDKSVAEPKSEAEWRQAWKQLDQWKHMKRIERQERAKITVASMTERESEALATSLELKNPNAKKFFKMDKVYDNLDLPLIYLLDYINGEEGKTEEQVFGGSLLKLDELNVEIWMKGVVKLLTSIPNTALLNPSNYLGNAKLQRAFYLMSHLFSADPKSNTPAASLLKTLSSEQTNFMKSKVKSLHKVIFPWAFTGKISSAAQLISSFKSDRGIVLTFGSSGFERGLLTILHIRKNLKCELPIEVFYNGATDLHSTMVQGLELIDNVKVIDLQAVFTRIAEDRNYHSKPFAILASSFKQVLYLDDDVILFQKPEDLFQKSKIFSEYGILFFKSPAYVAGNSKWVRWLLTSPTIRANTTGRFFNDVSKDEMDASLMLFDKSRPEIVHALLAATHFNLREVREGGMDKQIMGDKETYWFAHELLRIPYKFAPYHAGTAGVLQKTAAGKENPNAVCGPLAHMDETGKLLHVNSRSSWYNHALDDWFASLEFYITPATSLPGNIDAQQQPWCVLGSDEEGAKKEVFAVSEEEKALVAKTKALNAHLRLGWQKYLENDL